MRRSMTFGLLFLLVLGLATPAWAQDAQASEAFVVLSGRADVPEGQQVGDLVVFHGSATVDGTVDGSLTAFDAPVTISGRVNGDVVVFNGRVELASGANVTGDVVSQQAPVVASGATIGGERRRVETNTNWEGFGWAGKLAWWLAVSMSTLVVGLVLVWLVGRGAAWILEAGRTSIGPAIGWGLLVFFGLPDPGHHRPGHPGRDPTRPRPACCAGADLCARVRCHRLDCWPADPAGADRLGPGLPGRLGHPAGPGPDPHPGWSGLVRRGGVRPWRAAGGHLAGPDHQPRRPSNRLMTAPTPSSAHCSARTSLERTSTRA